MVSLSLPLPTAMSLKPLLTREPRLALNLLLSLQVVGLWTCTITPGSANFLYKHEIKSAVIFLEIMKSYMNFKNSFMFWFLPFVVYS